MGHVALAGSDGPARAGGQAPADGPPWAGGQAPADGPPAAGDASASRGPAPDGGQAPSAGQAAAGDASASRGPAPVGGRAPAGEVSVARPTAPPGRILAVPLPELPEVHPGDDLAGLIVAAWRDLAGAWPGLAARPGDVLVVTQKVVSKAEGRVVDLRTVTPRPEALEFGRRFDRDARQVEVVLREAAAVLRMERGVIICRTHHGFVCANAGVDASNVGRVDLVTLLPEDPDRSARALHERLSGELGVAVPVIVSDSFGRPWRWGIVDVALGIAGFLPLDDQRGRPDADGRIMHATIVAVADEIASTAELAAGKTSRRPVVLVRGATLPAGEGSVRRDVVMPVEADLFP